MLVRVDCNLCGSKDYKQLFDFGEIKAVKCNKCGLVFFNPQMRQEGLYEKEYFQSKDSGKIGYENYLSDKENIVLSSKKHLRQLLKFKAPPGKLLDIGCAAGFFLKAASELGWQCQGVEISKFASENARKLGFKVHNGKLRDAAFPRSSFDVITLWDTIEHLPDPLAELQEINAIMKNHGVLVIDTPNVDCISAKIFGSKWMQFKSKEHTFFFSKKTLKTALEKNGFKIVFTTDVGKHISFSLFVKRLKQYNDAFGSVVESIGSLVGLSKKSIYVNPRDSMMVFAEKISDV